MRKLLIIAASIVVILIVAEILFYQKISNYTEPAKSDLSIDPKSLLLSANEITTTTRDGKQLHGWLIQGRSGAPALIIAHDFDSNRSEVLSMLEGLITTLNKQGYFVLLFDFRGHGKSPGSSSLGYHEAEDVQAFIREILKYKQIDPRIAVLGIGMGAIAATKAAVGIDEIKLLVLDSLYDDVPDRTTNRFIHDLPFFAFARPVVQQSVQWNLKKRLSVPTLDLKLTQTLPQLFPKNILFAEHELERSEAKKYYEAAREPKELLLMKSTAATELIGKHKQEYFDQVQDRIIRYLPAEAEQPRLQLGN